MKLNKLIYLSLILLVLACGGAKATSIAIATAPPGKSAAQPTSAAQQTYKVGDLVAIGDWQIKINSVTYPQGSNFSKPDAGKKFVLVDLSVQNPTTESRPISSLAQMKLKDASGQQYQLDLIAVTAAKGTPPDGQVAAGETIRGQVGYQVPQDASGLTFVFEPDLLGNGKAFVKLE